MAQGDTIVAKVGDLIEVGFTLDFRQATVNQLPNKEKFKFVAFRMLCEEKNKEIIGQPKGVQVVRDDQEVTALFQFGPGGLVQDPEFFQAGEKWTLQTGYSEGSDFVEDGNLILLGFVQLKA